MDRQDACLKIDIHGMLLIGDHGRVDRSRRETADEEGLTARSAAGLDQGEMVRDMHLIRQHLAGGEPVGGAL
jgi:hypothetical protein